MCRTTRNQSGFTLVELIVVIAIIGVLSAIIIPTYITYIDKAKKSICDNQQQMLANAFSIKSTEDGGYASAVDAAEAFAKAANETLNLSATSTGKGSCEISDACPSGGVYTATFTSGSAYTINCSKHGESDLTLALERTTVDSVFTETNTTNGLKLIQAYYAASGNSLTSVSSSLIAEVFGSATLTNTDLYWRPDLINNVGGNPDYLMYASVGNDNTQSSWSGYIVYYNGHFYKSNNTNYNGTKITGTSVAMGNTSYGSSDDVISKLQSNGYTLVS